MESTSVYRIVQACWQGDAAGEKILLLMRMCDGYATSRGYVAAQLPVHRFASALQDISVP